MRNENILPNTEVPIKLRKEVYREALRIIESGEKKYSFQKYGYNWLCWMLPSVLYNEDCYSDASTVMDDFIFYLSECNINMFPETKDFLKNTKTKSNKERIKFLKTVI